jgi:hypothetical protein
MWCDNPNEHRREGERDFERGGRYGYNSHQYHDHWDDCAKHYQEGFDSARREEERRQEFREEQERQERNQERRRMESRREEREQEEEYYSRQNQWGEPEYPEPSETQIIAGTILPALNWSRKRIRHWCKQHHLKLTDMVKCK